MILVDGKIVLEEYFDGHDVGILVLGQRRKNTHHSGRRHRSARG